jgi:GMP synthase-like glutamine amidotransferase
MTPTVKIFRHAAHEGAGYFGEFLDRHGIARETIRVDAGDPIPTDLAGTAGLAFMGGPMSVNDPLPWIAPATALIRRAIGAGVPVLGHCLGGQLIAKALGAPVTRNRVREIGWHPVEVVKGDVARHWLGDLPEQFAVYHWHGETFALPEGATRLLSSACCSEQAFALGPHLGLQCHVEMTAEMVIDWVGRDPRLVASATVQSGPEMLRDLEARVAALHHVADRLYARWVGGLRP